MDIEYDWEVLEVVNDDEQGVVVRYTPTDKRLGAITGFVPVPWKKLQDVQHARKVMEGKINARAPLREWRKSLEPDAVDKSGEIVDELTQNLPKGKTRAADPKRSRNRPRVPQ